MHVTKKVLHPPCETPENLPDDQMEVQQHTTDDVARTAPPTDPRTSPHRLGSLQQYHLHSDLSGVQPGPADIIGDGEHYLKLDLLQKRHLTDVSEAYRRRYSNYADTKSTNSSQRMAVYNRLGNLQLNLDRLQRTLDKFTAKVDSSTTDYSTKKPKSRLRKLQTEVQLDVEAMSGQIQAVNGQMAELREQDRRLQHAEDAFDNAARAMSTALRRMHLVDIDEIRDMQSEVSLAPSSAYRSVQSDALASPVLPELAEYYKAISDLRIMQERFAYLETERNEQWERRVMLEEQDQDLDQTDDEFIEAWEKTLNEAEVNIEDARAATEEARHACHAANITVPDWDDASSADADGKQQHFYPSHNDTVLPPNIQPQFQIFDEIDQETPPGDHSSSPLTPRVNHQLIENRISKWVDDVVPTVAPPIPLGDSRTPPANDLKDSTGTTNLARPNGSFTVLSRSKSCPALPRHPYSTAVELSRPQTARGIGAEDDLATDGAIAAAQLAEVTMPP